MNSNEMAINRSDLNSYLEGNYNLNAMIPGIPQDKSAKKRASQMSVEGSPASNPDLEKKEKVKRL